MPMPSSLRCPCGWSLSRSGTRPGLRGESVLRRVSFVELVTPVAVVAVSAGTVGYVASGTTTNVGTTTAIGSENAKILAAEHASCKRNGNYASLETLEHDG